MGFQVSALGIDQFSHLFGQDGEVLAQSGVQRVISDDCPGYPCRVSLQDAAIGESMLLMNYEHQSAASPYRSSHAIYVREFASQARPDKNEIPESLRIRLLSVRSFDNSGMMLEADVIDGRRLERLIDQLFDNDAVDYLHVHSAKRGCYAARVERA